MKGPAFWKSVTVDESNLLEQLTALLQREGVRYCVVGGQAVNAYTEPLVSLDLDLVIASDELARLEPLLAERFRLERHPHSLNVSSPGSDLRVQVQLDERYGPFIQRASVRDVLGMALPVASVEDTLQGKIWAAMDPTRRASKRQKDLADIARLLERFPQLRARVPVAVLDRLI